MARLFSDENYDQVVVVLLRNMGHDIVTLRELGLADISFPDVEVLRIAAADQRALLTEDRDFRRLHRKSKAHAGIIQNTKDSDRTALAGRINDEIRRNPDLAGRFIAIKRPNDPTSGHGRSKKRKRR